jgi:hypothetical protein
MLYFIKRKFFSIARSIHLICMDNLALVVHSWYAGNIIHIQMLKCMHFYCHHSEICSSGSFSGMNFFVYDDILGMHVESVFFVEWYGYCR